VSQFIRCEAPSSLHPGVVCWFTPSPDAVPPTKLLATVRFETSLASLQTSFTGANAPSPEVVLMPVPVFCNLRIGFGIFCESFMGSMSLQIRPHTFWVASEILISLVSGVQDFFGHHQCLEVIVRSLLGIQGNCVTNLVPVAPKSLHIRANSSLRTESATPISIVSVIGERLLRKMSTNSRELRSYLPAPDRRPCAKATSTNKSCAKPIDGHCSFSHR
jgi:hypothetical protein